MRDIALASALALCVFAPGDAAGDLLADQRLAASWAAAGDLRGERIELNDDGGTFFALHAPSDLPEVRGAVVILHDQGTNADSHEVVQPLRLGLPGGGWETLSLQLPSVPERARRADWLGTHAVISGRLQAGLEWLRGRDLKRLVVIGVGDSGPVAVQFLADKGSSDLLGVVLVSSAITEDSVVGGLAVLRTLQQPVLDLYAANDVATVYDNVDARRRAGAQLPAGNFRQVAVAGARAGFVGVQEQLVATVRAWLAAHSAGR